MKQTLISALSGALMAALICALSLGSGPLPWRSGDLFGNFFETANASQNALMSPTTGTVSGLQLTNAYNNALDSLNTMNSGASPPTNQLSGTPSPGDWWLNSTASPYPANVYDGADWLAPFYIDATNHVLDMQMGGGTASIASAATVDLCSSLPQNSITVTGSTTITSFGSTCPPGVIKLVTFGGSLLLTYNSMSLIIPGGANVSTSGGDQAVLKSLGSGNWQVVAYTPANGQALINPAIDVGDYVMTANFNVPSSKYLLAYGQAISRTTYSTLLSGVTITQSVTSTNGSSTLTGFSDTTQIRTNAVIEASFLAAPSYILSCTPTTCTMANNANASTTASATIFPYGDGCGRGVPCSSIGTNFNLPDCSGYALAGRDNMSGTPESVLTSTYFGANPDALGAVGGRQSQNYTLSQANLGANWQFPNSNIAVGGNGQTFNACSGGSCGSGTAGALGSAAVNGTLAGGSFFYSTSITNQGYATSNGSSTPVTIPTIQPTLTANCMIRVLAMLELSPLPSPAINDNEPAIIDRRRAA